MIGARCGAGAEKREEIDAMDRSGAGGFYGWRIVAASFSILFVSVGIALYTPAVFLPKLEQEFGWSRAAISAAISIGAVVGALLSPLVGRWIDRWGARHVMSIGGLLMASGFFLLSQMDSLLQMYAFNLLAAMGVTAVAWIPNQTLISNWFERKRGLAMGITLAGIGFGGLLMAPLTSALIGALGWRFAYAGLSALILFVVVTLSLTVVRSAPADLGLLPDGDPPAPPDADSGPVPLEDVQPAVEELQGSPGLGEAARTRSFWIIAGSYFLVAFGQQSVLVHLVAFLGDAGFDDSVGAWSLGLTIGASVGGRLLFGLLADRYPKKWVMYTAILLHAPAILVLFRIGSVGALPAFIPIFGFAVGGSAVLFPLLVGECFGLRAYGQILGVVMLAAALGVATGPVLTGRIFDVSGSYDAAFALHVAAILVASFVIASLRRSIPPAAAQRS
jgi:MFS family permease